MSTNQDADLVADLRFQNSENGLLGVVEDCGQIRGGDVRALLMLGSMAADAIERLSAPLEVNDAMVVAAFRAYWGAIGGVDKRPFMTEDTMRATLNAALTERKA